MFPDARKVCAPEYHRILLPVAVRLTAVFWQMGPEVGDAMAATGAGGVMPKAALVLPLVRTGADETTRIT